MPPVRSLRARDHGVSLLELLIVIAVIGVIAGIATPTYLGWRADTRHSETVARLERELAAGRSDAKRRGVSIEFVLADGAQVVEIIEGDGVRNRSFQLPHGGSLVVNPVGEAITLAYRGAVAVQDPYRPVRFGLRTGSGLLTRTSTFTVLPPLGVTGVRRAAE